MTPASRSPAETPHRLPLAACAFGLFIVAHLHAVTAPLGLPLLLAGLLIAAWRGEIDFGRSFDRVDGTLLLFGVAWLTCSVAAEDPARAFELSVPVSIALFSAAVMRRVDDRWRSLDIILLALAVVAMALAGAVGVLQLIEARPVESVVAAIHSPWLVVPNDLAWAPCLWPLWKERWQRSGRPSWPLIILWALLFGGLLALQSRLGLLLLALVTLPVFFRGLSARSRGLLIATAAIGLVLAFTWLFDKGFAGVVARVQLWQAAWSLFLQHPWLGVGPHGFVLAYPELMAAGDAIDPRLTPWPHSLPLELLAEGGIVLAAAAGLLLFSARDAIGAWNRSSVLASILLLCLVEASTLRLWLWVLLVLFLLLSGARPTSHSR